MKRFTALLLMLMFVLPLGGCLDARSLDRFGYVLGIGFDRGEQLPYSVTLLLQNTQSGGEGNQNGGFLLVRAECRSLSEAILTLSANLPYTLDFARTMMLVFEQSIAREEGALDELLSVAFSRLRIRYNANVYVAVSSAYDAMEGLNNEIEPNLTRIQVDFSMYAERTGLVPVTNLKLLTEAFTEPCIDAAVPLCGCTPDEPESAEGDLTGARDYAYIGGSLLVDSEMKTGLAGAAIFSGSRMVGLLDGQNTQLLLMAKGEFNSGRYRLTDTDGKEMAAYLKADGAPRVTLTLGAKPHVLVEIRLHAVIEQPEDLAEADEAAVEALLARSIEEGLDRLYLACRESGSDAMGFGRSAIKKFASPAAWQAYDWKQAYGKLQADFIVSVRLSQPADKTGWE